MSEYKDDLYIGETFEGVNLPPDFIQKQVDDNIGYPADSEELSGDSEEVSIEENTNNRGKKKQKFIKKEDIEESKYPNNKKKKKKKSNQNEKREKDNKNRNGKEGKEKKNDQDEKQVKEITKKQEKDEKQRKEKNRNNQNENKKKTHMSNFNSFQGELEKRANEKKAREQEPKKEKYNLNKQSQENEEPINSKQIRDGGVQNKENPVKKNPDNNQLFELPQFKSLEVEHKNEKLNCFCDLKLDDHCKKSLKHIHKLELWPEQKPFVNFFKFKVQNKSYAYRFFGFCFHYRDYYILEVVPKGSTKCIELNKTLDIVYNKFFKNHEAGFIEKLIKHVGKENIFKYFYPENKKKEEDS